MFPWIVSIGLLFFTSPAPSLGLPPSLPWLDLSLPPLACFSWPLSLGLPHSFPSPLSINIFHKWISLQLAFCIVVLSNSVLYPAGNRPLIVISGSGLEWDTRWVALAYSVTLPVLLSQLIALPTLGSWRSAVSCSHIKHHRMTSLEQYSLKYG